MRAIVTIRKFNFNEAPRILLEFEYDVSIIKKVKSISGRQYSVHRKSWHIPYTSEAYQQFKNLDIPYTIELPTGTTPRINPLESEQDGQSDHTGIASSIEIAPTVKSTRDTKKTTVIEDTPSKHNSIKWKDKYFRVELAYVKADVDFIKSLSGAYWHKRQQLWLVPVNLQNAKALQSHFAFWTSAEFEPLIEKISVYLDPERVEVYLSPDLKDKILIKLHGAKADFAYLKTITEREYDNRYQRWMIPKDDTLLSNLLEHYTLRGAEVINRIPSHSKSAYKKMNISSLEWTKQLIARFPAEYREVLHRYSDALHIQRYSLATIESYLAAFGKFVTQCGCKIFNQVDNEVVNAYLAKLAQSKISDSQYNITISAIKFYFTKVVRLPNFELERIKRPRKVSKLPNILSVDEVRRMLSVTTNIKHRCLLFVLYGSGLRRGEVLNLQVTDLHWDRNQLYIRAAKGKKDRYAQLSEVTKMMMMDYVDAYKPQRWLFEGADKKTQYSGSSVVRVVKKSARKAGITKRVTPHTLRHCFATHSLEYGIDITFIQKLLGHQNVKTTMIYTHVTNDSLRQIKSPLDHLGTELTKKCISGEK